MLDVGSIVRETYVSKLNGFLTYQGRDVVVYGETPFDTTAEQYVIISSITDRQSNINNQKFIHDVDVNLDIFVEQYMRYDNAAVDNIANQILNILITSPAISDIGDASFEMYVMARTASRYLPLESGQNFVARKIITINNIIKQK
jgi:hypothetical protein